MACAKCGTKVDRQIQVKAEVKKIAEVVPVSKIKIVATVKKT